MSNSFFDDVAQRATETKASFLKKYEHFLKKFLPFRRLVVSLHNRLNRVQYDPLNPQNRTTDNPMGYQTEEEKNLADLVERDKNLLDKVETYFRLRPVSTAILAFFVISAAATSSRGQPLKIAIAVAVIIAILPLLTSKQDDFNDS